MESFISIIKFVSNPFSKESLAIGLLVLSRGQENTPCVFFRASDRKMDLARKLNPEAYALFKFSLDTFSSFIQVNESRATRNKKDGLIYQEKLDIFPLEISQEYMNRLAKYQNGAFQISGPEVIKKQFDLASFDTYFKKLVDASAVEENQPSTRKKTDWQVQVETKLYIPLSSVIDVNYTLKKKHIPSLLSDFHLEAIGVNGSLYTVKSLDFNNDSVEKIKNQIIKYDSLMERLEDFAKENGILGESKRFLVADEPTPEQTSEDRLELYQTLKRENGFLYEIFASSELNQVVDTIKQHKASKFSDLIKIAE
ncbi:MAG: hypothetical protein V4714_11395 [Bacteroidota bacterium]